MAVTASNMLALGTSAPDFNLPDTQGNMVSLDDFAEAPALLVISMCNHCPFVKHILSTIVGLVKEYQAKGVAVVGINSNDVVNYPDDSPEMMAKVAKKEGFTFPYLYDETQEIARTYGALRTPHFFVFNKEHRLVYTGRGVDNPRDTSKMTVNDLDRVLTEHLAGKPVSVPLTNPIGCNVKWEGKDQHWMPADACDLV